MDLLTRSSIFWHSFASNYTADLPQNTLMMKTMCSCLWLVTSVIYLMGKSERKKGLSRLITWLRLFVMEIIIVKISKVDPVVNVMAFHERTFSK